MKQLLYLLERINEGQPVNFDRLKTMLPDGIFWYEIFEPELISKKKYHVEVIDDEAFLNLLSEISVPKSRSDAATQKFYTTHDVNCESVYFLAYPKAEDRQLTAMSIIKDKVIDCNFIQASSCILIENQDCFFRWKEFTSFFLKQLTLDDCDVYFSSGSKVLHTKMIQYLSNYNKIFCLFDYDLAGISISEHLNKKIGRVKYLTPDNIKDMDHLFNFKPESIEEYISMLNKTQEMGLNDLNEIIKSKKHFMEQEGILSLTRG